MQDGFQNIAYTMPSDNRDVAKQAKQKYDARDLGKGWWREIMGHTAFSLPSPGAFFPSLFTSRLNISILEDGIGCKNMNPKKTSVQVISWSI